jgi:hypothetical protein
MAKAKFGNVIPIERIAARIYLMRGEQVMLDSDLAALYSVPTGRLNEQVTRNQNRFPEDFMFRLTQKEHDALRSQIATLKTGRGQHRKYLPRVFTEHGVAMLSAVLRTQQAVDISLAIVRTFVKLRRMLATNEELARKVSQHDHEIAILFEHVQHLLEPEDPKVKRPIGFRVAKSEAQR